MPPSWMKSTRTINPLAPAARLPQYLDLPQPLDHLLLARAGQPTGCLLVVDSSHAQLPLQFLLLGQDHQLQAVKILTHVSFHLLQKLLLVAQLPGIMKTMQLILQHLAQLEVDLVDTLTVA